MTAAVPVLDPAGTEAEAVATLSWVMIVGAFVILAIVLFFVAVAVFGGRWKQHLGGEKLIIGGGIVFPVVVLSALLIWGLALTANQVRGNARDTLRIQVHGEQWWWRVHYEKPFKFVSANEVVIPVGQPVSVELTSDNVIHSFWVPQLAGKLDMIPGRTNVLRLTATRPGIYQGYCAEYCGGAHALMLFQVIALEPSDYRHWAAAQMRPSAMPADEFAAQGAILFQRLGCGGCHRVAGTPAQGLAGPDLTHVASRRRLGAGILPNNRGTLAGWVANPQQLKPSAKMPAYSGLTGPELRALAAYMDGLE